MIRGIKNTLEVVAVYFLVKSFGGKTDAHDHL